VSIFAFAKVLGAYRMKQNMLWIVPFVINRHGSCSIRTRGLLCPLGEIEYFAAGQFKSDNGGPRDLLRPMGSTGVKGGGGT
jgi:hypothetical protein